MHTSEKPDRIPGSGNWNEKTGPSFKSVDSPFRPVVKVVALIAA